MRRWLFRPVNRGWPVKVARFGGVQFITFINNSLPFWLPAKGAPPTSSLAARFELRREKPEQYQGFQPFLNVPTANLMVEAYRKRMNMSHLFEFSCEGNRVRCGENSLYE